MEDDLKKMEDDLKKKCKTTSKNNNRQPNQKWKMNLKTEKMEDDLKRKRKTFLDSSQI
jgi:hypothetical protein